MQLSSRLFVAAGILLGAPALAADRTLVLAHDTAVVLDGEGTPLVRAPRGYLLEWAANPDGTLFEIDSVQQRVRVTPDGAPALWLRCADLAESPCDQPRDVAARSAPTDDGQEASSRTLPICPGDPRCPR